MRSSKKKSARKQKKAQRFERFPPSQELVIDTPWVRTMLCFKTKHEIEHTIFFRQGGLQIMALELLACTVCTVSCLLFFPSRIGGGHER